MSDVRDLLGVLRQIHDLHRSTAQDLTAEQLRSNSYDPDWIVASLLSHMGSQAEIMNLFINASVAGNEAPGREVFEGVWDRWNAMSPEEQRDGSIAGNDAHVALLESLTDEQLDAIDVPFFGDIDGAEFVRIRIDEYAVHIWDLVVTFDPQATLLPTSVPVLLDQMGRIGGRYKFGGTPFSVQINTTTPERSFVGTFGDTVELRNGIDNSGNAVTLPAEAFVRLVFGRLDFNHTPANVSTTGDVTLDDLRSIFVGF